MEATWRLLRALWWTLGAPERLLELHGGHLGPLSSNSQRSLGVSGRSLGASWESLGVSGRSLEAFGRSVQTSGRPLRAP